MPSAFKYDVAITAADFDALTADELRRRLEHRLAKPVFTPIRLDDGGSGDSGPEGGGPEDSDPEDREND